MESWTYSDRWAIVTGASAGIGETFARELARRGMNLVLAARREDRLRALADELRGAHGIQTAVIPVDLGAPDAAAALWRDATAAAGQIDLLVNNAGFGLKGDFAELDRARQADMVRVDCIALLELCHLALSEMRPRRAGGIINVASVAAYQAIPSMATYAASKAFVLSLSEALAEEHREDNVLIVALCPGPVITEFQDVAGTGFGPHTPGLRTAGEVVAAALSALERGETVVVPGLLNRAAAWATHLIPRHWAVRTAGQVMRRAR